MANPKIQIRHDTSTNWTTVNPVLLEGEIGYETDTNKIKIGDGTTDYKNLSYITGDIDVSNYYTKAETSNLLLTKENVIIYGSGLQKTNNTIQAYGSLPMSMVANLTRSMFSSNVYSNAYEVKISLPSVMGNYYVIGDETNGVYVKKDTDNTYTVADIINGELFNETTVGPTGIFNPSIINIKFYSGGFKNAVSITKKMTSQSADITVPILNIARDKQYSFMSLPWVYLYSNQDDTVTTAEATNDNYVTVNSSVVLNNTAQTINGNKSFSGYTTISNQILPTNYYNSSHSTKYGRLTFNGNNLQINSINGGINLQCNTADDKIYKINSTATTTKYQVLTEEDKNTVAEYALPGTQYTDLTLAASGTNYTMPANGYLCLNKRSEAAGEYGIMLNNTSHLRLGVATNAPNTMASFLMPVRAGDEVNIAYTLSGVIAVFRFVYAEGAI